MNKHIDMPCCICSKQVSEAEYISVDENGDVIVMCPECYHRAKKFFIKEDNDVKS